VHPDANLVVFASRKRHANRSLGHGGFYDLEYDQGRDAGHRWAPWILEASKPGGPITLATNPGVASGWPLRYTLHCRVCRDDHPLTNRRMIELVAHAVEANSPNIVLLGGGANPHHS
jgi:hypothetical protein